MTLYYDDFRVGSSFKSGAIRVRQADINSFARLTGDLNPLHLDAKYARGTIFGRRIAHGLLILSMALGLWYRMDLTRTSLIALLGISEVSFQSPAYAREEVHLVSKVVSKRLSKSRGGAGIVIFRDRVENRAKRTILEFERVLMLKTRAGADRG